VEAQAIAAEVVFEQRQIESSQIVNCRYSKLRKFFFRHFAVSLSPARYPFEPMVCLIAWLPGLGQGRRCVATPHRQNFSPSPDNTQNLEKLAHGGAGPFASNVPFGTKPNDLRQLERD
jgi:hypothetical protein